MSDFPTSEQDCQKDVLQRIHSWLCMLEQRISLLSTAHRPEDMKPGECEQAITRHLTMMLRLFQLRQQYARDGHNDDTQRFLESILYDDVDSP
jgi:hypothetical protein